MSRGSVARMIFVTGTDTGVGKTLLTGLLLYHLRSGGCRALAMKPFASGNRNDARFLQALQGPELTLDEINPFYFPQPVAPLAAIRSAGRSVSRREVVRRIKRVAESCQCLLIEGIGGLMVPLGRGYFVLDLIQELGCETVLVAANRLGTISHTLLSARMLQHAGIVEVKTVLMRCGKSDPSVHSNAELLRDLLRPAPVFEVPFLGPDAERFGVVTGAEKKLKKTLAQILS